jgi:hypothetical protein
MSILPRQGRLRIKGRPNKQSPTFALAWLAISRRKKRTVISIILLSFVIGSSITIASTIQQFPVWVSALSGASPTLLLSYQKSSQFVGLIPVNSTVSSSDSSGISQIEGVSSVTPLIIEDLKTSFSNSPSIVVGLDLNFWELGLGLNNGHWPAPNSSQAVIAQASGSESTPSTITISNEIFQVVGIALTSDLALSNSVVISYSSAQKLFSLEHSASVFVIQVSSAADPSIVSNEIDQTDSSLATIELSSSTHLLDTVTKVIGSISNVVIFAEATFAFAIISTLTLSNIHTRRWEYSLVSSYGGRHSVFKMILYENWLVFSLAILPALLIAIGVLTYFTTYFNSLFGVNISLETGINSALAELINATTGLNYLGALISTSLGSMLAIKIVLPKLISRSLVDQQS